MQAVGVHLIQLHFTLNRFGLVWFGFVWLYTACAKCNKTQSKSMNEQWNACGHLPFTDVRAFDLLTVFRPFRCWTHVTNAHYFQFSTKIVFSLHFTVEYWNGAATVGQRHFTVTFSNVSYTSSLRYCLLVCWNQWLFSMQIETIARDCENTMNKTSKTTKNTLNHITLNDYRITSTLCCIPC